MGLWEERVGDGGETEGGEEVGWVVEEKRVRKLTEKKRRGLE